MAAGAGVDGSMVAFACVARHSLCILNLFARAAAGVGPAFGDERVEGCLIRRAALRLPHDGCVRHKAALGELLEDVLVCTRHAARCVYVFYAHQPLPAMRARIEPAGEGRNKRARM